jgi:integrase
MKKVRKLFISSRGTGRGYARAVQKAGLPPKPFHSLRKSCATELERVGCPQGLISAILGHSGGGVTRLYIHNSEEMMREFLNRVCEAVAGHAEEEAV